MISPYEVKDRQHNKGYNDPFELKIDKGLTYSSATDSCDVIVVVCVPAYRAKWWQDCGQVLYQRLFYPIIRH